MALTYQSLLLYGFEVTVANSAIDFKLSGGGSEKNATLNLGFYSLTSLLEEITRAMSAADNSVNYFAIANRNVSGGLENRVTISTDGVFLSLLFSSGSRNASSVASLIGFTPTDRTGSTSYTGSSTAGTALVTELAGYNYIQPEMDEDVQGSVTISASGIKESISFGIMDFLQIEWKHEPKTKVINSWKPFFRWAMQQKSFEITPDYTLYNQFYEVTLEKTQKNGKGLGQVWREMLPDFPNEYETQPLEFRTVAQNGQFIV